jgi:hypothetical protein
VLGRGCKDVFVASELLSCAYQLSVAAQARRR